MILAFIFSGTLVPHVYANRCMERPAFSGNYESHYDEYTALTNWAAGAAFSEFSDLAGFVFDREAYMADCPNLPLFGYALHEGPNCNEGASVDRYYVTWQYLLQRALSEHPETFKAYFMEKAAFMKVSQYLHEKP
jgi:hypothetical protein